jgi:hypothetical protein
MLSIYADIRNEVSVTCKWQAGCHFEIGVHSGEAKVSSLSGYKSADGGALAGSIWTVASSQWV